MTEQPEYKLYAIRLADLPQGAVKGFQYSLQANNRYLLLLSKSELQPPFRKLPDDIQLTEDEKKWKVECEHKIIEENIKKNVKHIHGHKDEYTNFLNQFCDMMTEELEKKKIDQEAKVNKKDNL